MAVAGQTVMLHHGRSYSAVELLYPGSCRSCPDRKDLWWAKTAKGKTLLVVPPANGQTIFEPHFADCPAGPQWSKKTRHQRET